MTVSRATEGGVPDKEASVTGGYYQAGKPGSGKEKRTLQSVKTHFYVGTEVYTSITIHNFLYLSL